MLEHLTIRNYALIRELELKPSAGLNVITGETGAGKSIMLGAIGLLTGNRADTKVLWNENEKCVTEGVFNISNYELKAIFEKENLDYDAQTVIRREITPGGKSRAFINDTPVTLDVMKKVGSYLLDIHSQHEALLPGDRSFQLFLIDAYAANGALRHQYSTAWDNYVQARDAYADLKTKAEQTRQEADYINFQLEEFDKANLSAGEQQQLESELQVQDHAEEIKLKFQQAQDLLEDSEFAARASLSEAKLLLHAIRGYSASYDVIHHRLESILIELNDILGEIAHEQDKVSFDPERTTYLKERLSTIYRLQQKHGLATVDELLSLHDTLKQKARFTEHLDGALAVARQNLDRAEAALNQSASTLSDSRKKITSRLATELITLLKDLGIPDAQILITLQAMKPGPDGADKADVQFSANKGIQPRPLSQVASGGEFSRLMLCIKYIIAEKTSLPTLILDEIDSGVSGEIAIQLGSLMKKMAASHQLIAITHLPQIAAKGDEHYFVFKENTNGKTVTNIRLLSNDDRVAEIAQMIGGANPSKGAVEGAKELLAEKPKPGKKAKSTH